MYQIKKMAQHMFMNQPTIGIKKQSRSKMEQPIYLIELANRLILQQI